MIADVLRTRLRLTLLWGGCCALFVSSAIAFEGAGKSAASDDDVFDADRVASTSEDFFAADETRYFDDESESDSPSQMEKEESTFSGGSADAKKGTQTTYEPAWSTWSPYTDPNPLTPPIPGEYLLVRPPARSVQDPDEQTYIGRVGSADDLDYFTAVNPPPLDPERPDTMAPSGIFNANMLNAGGQFLISYRFNDSFYRGNMDGTSGVANSTVLSQFTLVPTKMRALTHNIMVQYAPTDDLNIQGILPIVERTMTFENAAGGTTQTHITDLSDVSVTAMYVLRRWERAQLNLNMGIHIPVGIFDELSQQQQGAPTPNSPVLTYPMRTSDGTYDMLPGLTYIGQSDDWTLGAQTSGIARFGLNRYGYRLGQQFDATAWLARRLNDSFSASCRLDGQVWGNIHRADTRLNQALVETNVPSLQAGQTINLLFGINSYVPTIGPFTGRYNHNFSFEMGLPIYQNLSGPQLQQRFVLFANWNITF